MTISLMLMAMIGLVILIGVVILAAFCGSNKQEVRADDQPELPGLPAYL